jgi:protoporphyrinogen oxidase
MKTPALTTIPFSAADQSGRRVAVLGAGALGLTVAHRLARAGCRVTVFEREPSPGGLAAGYELEPGIWLEKFYHHIFRSDKALVRLMGEVGLADRMIWHRPLTASWIDDRYWPLDSPLALLRFKPLPILDRLRMGVVIAALRALPSGGPLEGRLAASWIRRWMGSAAFRVIWGPLLQGKFGAAAETISLPWFWARLHDRSPDLGYPQGGFQPFYEALSGRIKADGGLVRLGSRVLTVEPSGQDLSVRWSSPEGLEQAEHFDQVVSTLATRLTAELVPTLPPSWRETYAWGQAYGARCLILALDRPLTKAYWLNLDDQSFPFLVMVEHTNMRPAADYAGRHLIYLGTYRPMDDPLLRAPIEELMPRVLAHLVRFNPDFDPSWVTATWSFSAPFAQPLVTPEYPRHIPPFETPIRGLFVASMFQVYPHDRGQNYSIELGERLAQQLLKEEPLT